MRILLLGKTGRIGSKLQSTLLPLGEIVAPARKDLDLEDIGALRLALVKYRPALIVNAAAYTNVDLAESDPERARRINCDAVAALADYASCNNARLVHYSTDYVFDGKKDSPYLEDDATRPLNVYGATKRDGERAVRAAKGRHLILRTSWVYSAHGANFALKILKMACERDELRVVADQIGAPTSAQLIADSTASILDRLLHDEQLSDTSSGTYHLTAADATSWYGFAKFLVGEASRQGLKLRCSANDVKAILAADYKTSVTRPANSCLHTAKLCKTFDLNLPLWSDDARKVVSEFAAEAMA